VASEKRLNASINIGSLCLTINDNLKDYKPLKDILNSISSRGPNIQNVITVTVQSGSDLKSFFEENDLEEFLIEGA